MLVLSFGLPVLLTGRAYLPMVSKIISKARPYLLWPSTVGIKHVQSLSNLLRKPPFNGQALYVVLFVIIDVVFTAAGYESR